MLTKSKLCNKKFENILIKTWKDWMKNDTGIDPDAEFKEIKKLKRKIKKLELEIRRLKGNSKN